MNKLIILGIGVLVSFIVALFFEESREWIFETFAYIISLEWLSDIGDLFEGIGEFSFLGLLGGAGAIGFVFYLREYILNPFLNHMSPVTSIFWMVATYMACFVGGYLIAKKVLEDE